MPVKVSDSQAVVVSTQSACRFLASPGFTGESQPLRVRLWDGFLGQTGPSVNIVQDIDGFGGFSGDDNLLELVADVSNELFEDSFE